MCDAQSGHEKTLTGLLPALAGANLIYGLGMIEMGMTIDFGQLVMDNEFAKMIKFVLQGIPVNDEMLATDVIHEIGIGKDFLGHISTLNHMNSQSQPKLIDRRMRQRWQAAGGTDIYQRALEEARHILKTHKPDPLPDDVLATMRAIVEEAEEELGVIMPKADK
ncbi:MAG: trimethylamine methyltransferase family protein [Deltaproteobacteria bacterium]|nr:trimethylamine methyltransferase family protein [Deltaproteobacteria bacterium]